MSDDSNATGAGLREPLTGFAAALALTLVPFAAVAAGTLPTIWTAVVIGVCGFAQILVHMRYFLHVRWRGSSRDDLLALAFAAVIVLLMVGGTLWIMLDLHGRTAL